MTSVSISVRVMKDGTGAAIRLSEEQKSKLVRETAQAVKAATLQNLQAMVYDRPEPASGPRTGALKNSVDAGAVPGASDTWEVYASAEHAVYVHEGTRSMSPRPFLTDALLREQRRVLARARRISRGTT